MVLLLVCAHACVCVQARSLQGFWSELQWNTDRTKYLEAVPNPRYRTSHIQADWDKLVRFSVYFQQQHLMHINEHKCKFPYREFQSVDGNCLTEVVDVG